MVTIERRRQTARRQTKKILVQDTHPSTAVSILGDRLVASVIASDDIQGEQYVVRMEKSAVETLLDNLARIPESAALMRDAIKGAK